MAAQSGNMAVSVLLRAVDHISKPVKGVQSSLSSFGRAVRSIGASDGFRRLTASLQRAKVAAQELSAATGRVVRRLAMIGAGAVAGIVKTTMAVAALGDNVAKTADKLGVGIERLQEMRFAAERAGVSQQTFDNSLQAFTRRVAEAAQGSGEAAAALDELGLSSKALKNMAPDQAMGRVADALSGVTNQSDRVRLAFNLFGREGISMVNMLKDGSAGLDDMYSRARGLGLVLSTDTARSAEVFDDAMTDMKSAMLGVRNTIGGALMPIFIEWMGKLTDLVVRYQPQIQAWAQNFAAALPGRLAQLKVELMSLLDAVQPIIDIGAALVDRFGAVQSAVAVLGVFIGAPILIPLVQFMAALTGLATTVIPIVIGALKALALAAIANPIIAIVAAIALGAILLITYWDKVAPWFSALWKKLVGYISGAWDSFAQWLGWDPLTIIAPVWNFIIGYFSSVMDAVKRLFTGDLTAIKDLFKWSPLGLIKMGVDATINYLSSIDWQAAAASAWDRFKSIFRWTPLGLLIRAFDQVSDWFGNQDWSAHGQALLKTLADGIMSMATAPVEAVRKSLSMARNLLPFSDAKEGPLSALTASGRALPGTLAEGVTAGAGTFIDAVTGVAGAARNALSTDAANFGIGALGDAASKPVPINQTGRTIAKAPTQVNHIDFRPSVTVQVSNAHDAQNIADEIDNRLERMLKRDLWAQIQRVQEVAG